MDLKEELIEKASRLINDTNNFKVEDVTLNVYENDDGTKNLSVEIKYNDEKQRIRTADGDMWA